MTPTILDPDFFPLFHAVQQSGIFSDSKTFCDMQPRRPLTQIYRDFQKTILPGTLTWKPLCSKISKRSVSPPRRCSLRIPRSHTSINSGPYSDGKIQIWPGRAPEFRFPIPISCLAGDLEKSITGIPFLPSRDSRIYRISGGWWTISPG